MKRYEKSKFWFLGDDNSRKEPKEGDRYFNLEWNLKLKFPFLVKIPVCYVLKNGIWEEETE